MLSLSVATLLVAFSSGLRQTSIARDYTYALIIAESRLASINSVISDIDRNSSGMDGKFSWQTKLSPIENKVIGNWQLYDIDVTVKWSSLGSERSLFLQSLSWGHALEKQ